MIAWAAWLWAGARPVFRDVVDAAGAARMTPPQPFEPETYTAPGAKAFDGGSHVLGTAWVKTAMVSQ